MAVVVVTPPDPAIDLDLVKAHVRVDHDDDDVLLEAYVAAAVSHIDGPAGWLGRAIWPQTLELRQNVFGCGTRLPYGPVQSIESVKYVGADGTEQTLDPTAYDLLSNGEIGLTYGASWPSLRGDAEGVRIRYVAGFETVPAAIMSAVLLTVGDLYAFRETAQVGSVAGKIPMSPAVENLLAPYRVWSF